MTHPAFVILGASKTGTSTAVAAANAHPSVFCFFETDFSQPPDHARNAEAVALLANLRSCFLSAAPFVDCLSQAKAELQRLGWRFERIGTKVPGVRPDILPQLGQASVLFMVRDVRLWAVKNRVVRDVLHARSTTNVVPFLVAYARYFLDAFTIERCRRLPLDHVLSTDLTVLPQALADLLEIPRSGFESWWRTAPVWTRAAPKNYSTWITGHTSAFLPPLLVDTNGALSPHRFWDAFLPIFDKYFSAPNKTYTRSEILRDQRALDDIDRTFVMTLEDGYERFESFKIRGLSKTADGKLALDATDRLTRAEIDQAAQRWNPEEA